MNTTLTMNTMHPATFPGCLDYDLEERALELALDRIARLPVAVQDAAIDRLIEAIEVGDPVLCTHNSLYPRTDAEEDAAVMDAAVMFDERDFLVLTDGEARAAWGGGDGNDETPAIPPLVVYPDDDAAHDAALRYFES
ncbi:hypothetical protein [Acidithiobacillus caldus]|uniref:hypothetical protein n=1 Tax=Acidithiobacillus caldus TaxID=33059 RepID=UPI0007F34149|nr:hypothetical protein [Acidithiobacillus caldus]QER43217.1 hypothetical protein F0726_00125 [Acidithiobacillus caldus]